MRIAPPDLFDILMTVCRTLCLGFKRDSDNHWHAEKAWSPAPQHGTRLHPSRRGHVQTMTLLLLGVQVCCSLVCRSKEPAKRSTLAERGYSVATAANDRFASRRTTCIVTCLDPGTSPTVSFQSPKVTLCFTPFSVEYHGSAPRLAQLLSSTSTLFLQAPVLYLRQKFHTTPAPVVTCAFLTSKANVA